MSRWITVFVALAISGAGLDTSAQTRGSAGSSPAGPAARPRPHTGPSQPAPPAAVPPFRSTLVFVPAGASPHRMRPLRLPWFGLVLMDPYWWTSDDVFPPFAQPSEGRPTGGLQLDVEPRRALVYVDGWFVGVVEDFKGYFQHLDLAAGPHLIELLAPDYDPLVADIVVAPGRTTTYRGSLNRAGRQ